MIALANLNAFAPPPSGGEALQTLLETRSLRIERIVSLAHSTPQGEWYDQQQDEWVILLQGSAGLQIDGQPQVLILQPGDYCYLPAHCRHRVAWTDAQQPSVWLALHFSADPCESDKMPES
jgi:cupin 2 domain-containing protein